MDWACDTNVKYPMWLRLQYLALGRCDETGIATFKAGELAKFLYGGADRNRNLSRDIKEAVRYGLLHTDSSRRHLRLPDHVVRSGPSIAYKRRCVSR
ncbi:Uncharacterised protein [Mycobacteroides abscessus]|nr:Uncharacterised protein [Mycobacteroides abscessus]